jgi:hypothetical protein
MSSLTTGTQSSRAFGGTRSESSRWRNGGAAPAVEDRGAAPACSIVAIGATLTAILAAAHDAIAAIADGDVAVAKARLQAIIASASRQQEAMAFDPA